MMDKQEHREAAIKALIGSHRTTVNGNWDEQLLNLHGDIDQPLSTLVYIDTELERMIADVQEWEEELLGGLEADWY